MERVSSLILIMSMVGTMILFIGIINKSARNVENLTDIYKTVNLRK